MSLYENKLYIEDVNNVSTCSIPWEKLNNKSIVISGATGLIGSFLIDVILKKNNMDDLKCKVYALCRDEEKAKLRFVEHIDNEYFKIIKYDAIKPLVCKEIDKIDFVIHLASNTHPKLYSTDPIGTITTNIIGIYNLLEFAVEHKADRFILASSNEIYGENRGDTEFFNEDYCGYINCNTLRAGYPESKRCSEALCQAYIVQKNLDVVIARITRTFGPTMIMSDTKALSQFIKNGLEGKDIVLKSSGIQYYSYTYVADAVCGLLTILLKGESGEAYNISNEKCDIQLRDLALMIAKITNKKVVFELPDEVEAAGYSKVTKARLSGEKLQQLGWIPEYDIKDGIERTINILKTL